MNMGLIAKWWQLQLDSVKAEKRKKDMTAGLRLKSGENKDGTFKLDKLSSCFLCWSIGLVFGILMLCNEIGIH